MILTKRDTRMLKGIALLLMIMHHLFAFPKRIPIGLEFQSLLQVQEISIETSIGIFGKICVSFYMFLGGYGMWYYVKSGGYFIKEL